MQRIAARCKAAKGVIQEQGGDAFSRP
jgi:hypothetical protein